MIRQSILGLCLTACLAFSSWAYSQSTTDAPHLQAQTAAGQTTFRIGERIPLELSFTGPDNKRFEINQAAYDRSGRMSAESFQVSPNDGWVDPLKAYFSTGGFFGGGLSTVSPLSAKPVVISIDLNEWVRIDHPGVYRVIVTSRRVSDVQAGGGLGQDGIALRSNPVELRIIAAGKAWQDAQLAAILAALKKQPESPRLPDATRAAIANLRYLGTEAAAGVMARHIREDEPNMQSECAFGLMGLPTASRPAALGAMRNLFENPDFPVSGWFVTTYSMLQLGDPDADAETVSKELRQNESEDLKLVMGVLAAKRGPAKTATAEAIWGMPKTEFTPQMEALLGAALRSGLAGLTIDRRIEEWSSGWDRIRSPELLPLLKQDAEMSSDDPSAKVYPDQARMLKEAAFRRWYELDPEAAHQSLLKQIGSANPALGPESVDFLPDHNLPQYEHVWADSFATTSDYNMETRLTSLMTRFGVGSEVPLVRDKANRLIGKWACDSQGAALAYLVKFDPASARSLVDRAVAERGPKKSACNRSLFEDIARWTTDPLLTEAAVSTLNDPDPQVINDALIYLTSFGDKSVEKPIWDRYVMWSAHWRGREDLLDKRDAGTVGNWAESGLGLNLAHALIANQGWFADDALVARVLQLCVGKQMCDQVKQAADRAGEPIPVTVFRSGAFRNFQIAQYTAKSLELLEAKIAQFPRGSKFVLLSSSDSDDQRRLEDQVSALFERHGMSLQK